MGGGGKSEVLAEKRQGEGGTCGGFGAGWDGADGPGRCHRCGRRGLERWAETGNHCEFGLPALVADRIYGMGPDPADRGPGGDQRE